MNFLALVQRFCRDCGIAGTGPTAVTGQTGELARMVNYIQNAWIDIQAEHQDWAWLRASITPLATTNGQATYTLANFGISSTFGQWDRNSFRCYVTASGTDTEMELSFIDYDEWKRTYQLGSARTTYGRPTVFTIQPNKSIGLGQVPTGDYTITADYYTSPVELSANTDEPAMPSQYHMAIVYRAMMAYGSFESATEVYQRGETEYKKIMRRMAIDRLPEMLVGDPLA